MKNILQTATDAGAFSTLLTAIKTAGLEETLNGNGPFTVFAPNDEAFKKIPAETMQAVLKDKTKLTSILTYHVVAGKLMAKDIANETSTKTVQGTELAITKKGADIMVNDAKVMKADIECSNGVIHIIDTVLMPK
jgi:uncharacterized surface protein with fasciclin (FAS1) repeats